MPDRDIEFFLIDALLSIEKIKRFVKEIKTAIDELRSFGKSDAEKYLLSIVKKLKPVSISTK